jgi:hypothetical protein
MWSKMGRGSEAVTGHMKGLGVKRYPHGYLGTHRERTGYKEKRYAIACTEGISK